MLELKGEISNLISELDFLMFIENTNFTSILIYIVEKYSKIKIILEFSLDSIVHSRTIFNVVQKKGSVLEKM